MLRREALSALRAYTQLPESIQGVLELRGEEYVLAGGISRSHNFDRALKDVDTDVFCVSRLRVMRSALDLAGEVQGAFILRGKAVRLSDNTILSIASVVVGTVPTSLRSEENAYLLTIKDEDFMRCASPQQMPYGINTVTDALAPKWNYISAVFSKKIPHAVVCCSNGVFGLRAAARPSELGPSEAEQLIDNLLNLDIVIEVEAPKPKTIYRVASNCILAGGDQMQEQIAALQASLQIPSYLGGGRTLPNSLANFSIDASLLQLSGPTVEYDLVSSAVPAGASLRRESLTKWWRAPASFFIRLGISLPSNASPASSETAPPLKLQWRLKDGALRQFNVDIEVSGPSFRDPRPGETPSSLRHQLKGAIQAPLERFLRNFKAQEASQGNLDAFTQSLGEHVATSINTSQLFDASVAVNGRVSFEEEKGETASLPSGDLVVIPRYAYDLDSVRLSAFLGAFSSLGLQGSFTAWPQALRNRVNLI
jgi:hypothetical protein